MNAQERLKLLEALQELAHREAENVSSLERHFMPLPAHRLALRPEIVIVRGGRGVGKSMLFKLLGTLGTAEKLRRFFGDPRLPDATWVEAFAQSALHPDAVVLDALAKGADIDALRAFWMAHLLLRIDEDQPGLVSPPAALRDAWRERRADPGAWVPVAREHLGSMAQALDQVERALQARRQMVFATYDHLDRIGTFDAAVRRRYVSALLAMWLSYSNRYNYLRAKIFLRDDLLDAGELGFPDASKLRARSVSIDWDVESLYRVAVRHMAESSEGLREWLGRIKHGFRVEADPELGWMPGSMPEDTQWAFSTQLAGELMGAGAKKGYTYRWIPNRLQDAQQRIVPRSMLCLLGFAAKEASRHPASKGVQLVTPQDLAASLEETSRARVGEIKEEYPLVQRLENLRGLMVMLDPDVAKAQLAKPVIDEPAGLTTDGDAVLDELVRLGVLSVRSDGRIDVPDIYRSGFGILRKGGVARPR